jgi:hypothetical protein
MRGTIEGAQEMGLTQAQTVQALSEIRHGLAAQVQTRLAAAGHQPTNIHNFIADASMLPAEGFQLAQSTAPRSGPGEV